VLCGSWGAEHFRNAEMSSWLRRVDRNGTPLIAVELGVYLLARAGLLSRRRVTTHWSWRPGFAEEFPATDVCEQLYTIDGNVMTCAGGTAGTDLMLHLVAKKHGDQLAVEVANQMLHGTRRPPETPQRLVAGGLEEDVHPDVRGAMLLIEANIEEPVSIPAICRKLGTSQRQLQRLFRRDTGCTIVQFSQLLRLQHARVVLSSRIEQYEDEHS
jgi:transcriptional regulator GlxA family with amidase domain